MLSCSSSKQGVADGVLDGEAVPRVSHRSEGLDAGPAS